ncbi:MAG: alpha/beta hydrolase [Terracidiphilus sp.]|nr:alpha/beta hydrolase [Terracidiphilus sp.]
MDRFRLGQMISTHFQSQAKRIFLVAAVVAVAVCGANVCAQNAAPAAVPVEVALPHGDLQYLWPAGAPGAVGGEEQDKPYLEIFGATGPGAHPAVIVCPGGSYIHLAYEKEGVRIAEWLNLHGVTAFVLTYRLAPRYKYPAPIDDGKRAVRWVRSHAAEYHVAPDKVGMWGFSAGGHLVGMVGTHFDTGNPQASDPVERASDRPDFVVSSYGLMTLDAETAKPGSLSQFVNGPITPELVKELSPAKNVSKDTPPFFLFATTTDERVPVLTSVAFYVAMQRAGAPVEMHLFEQGPHGVGLAPGFPALSAWPSLLETWLKEHGWTGVAAAAHK